METPHLPVWNGYLAFAITESRGRHPLISCSNVFNCGGLFVLRYVLLFDYDISVFEAHWVALLRDHYLTIIKIYGNLYNLIRSQYSMELVIESRGTFWTSFQQNLGFHGNRWKLGHLSLSGTVFHRILFRLNSTELFLFFEFRAILWNVHCTAKWVW